MCSGDQCCPGFAGSGGGTFPCPSASSGFSGCANNTKVTNCVSSSLRGSLAEKVELQDTCAVGADVQCPGSGSMCAGDQCCPGFAGSGGGTFPCPSASSGFSGCVNKTKVKDCTSSGTVVTTTATTTTTTMTTTTITTSSSGTCKIGADVQCPGSGNMCSGDQCCPGFAGSGGGTFPCPSASSGFSGCVNNTKVKDCTSS